jgi:hypothetical protein
MRRDVAASMAEYGFYAGGGNRPLLAGPAAVPIGIPQIDGVFGYYWLAALPLRLVGDTDVALQLYLTRLVSLGFLLISVAAGWGTTTELTRPGSSLRWFVPLTMAMLPAFVNLMTSLNNDVGATAFACVLFWGMARLLRRGFSISGVAWVAVAGLTCLSMKATTLPVVLVASFAVVTSLFGRRMRAALWSTAGIAAVLAGAAFFGWDDAAYWVRRSEPRLSVQVDVPNAPLGRRAIRLAVEPDQRPTHLSQLLSPERLTQLAGQTVTLGGYMWSDADAAARLPSMTWPGSSGEGGGIVSITPVPTFHAFTLTVPAGVERAWVSLVRTPGDLPDAVTVYYDGLALALGERPLDQPPHYANADGATGIWGGAGFDNLLRNGSGEQPQPFVRPAAAALLAPILMTNPNTALGLAIDWRADATYADLTRTLMFETFWARFGWGHVRLTNGTVYAVLQVVTLAGILGALMAMWRGRRSLPWNAIALFGLATASVWFASITRGIDTSFGSLWIPGARYAAPVIIPTCLLLVAGWREWSRAAVSIARRAWSGGGAAYLRVALRVTYVVGLALLDAYALASQAQFYAGRT